MRAGGCDPARRLSNVRIASVLQCLPPTATVDQAEIKTGHADLSENEDMEVIVIVTVPWYSILHVQT